MPPTSWDTTTLSQNDFQIYSIKFSFKSTTITEDMWSTLMIMNAWCLPSPSDWSFSSSSWVCAWGKASFYHILYYKSILSRLHALSMVFSMHFSFTCTSLVHIIFPCTSMLSLDRSYSTWLLLLFCSQCSWITSRI